jgi:ribosomal protein L32
MAVPKKKTSYSKTRKRFLVKKSFFTSYISCSVCSNFYKLHCVCSFCFVRLMSTKQGKDKVFQYSTDKSIVNINEVYYLDF